MTGRVPHRRPELPTYDDMLSGRPVSAVDWSTLASAANWINGRGAQIIPWCAIGHTVASGSSASFLFRATPKAQSVAHVWAINMLASAAGATATVTINGTSMGVRRPATSQNNRRSSEVFLETLSAKTSSTTTYTVTVAAAGGNITVESLGMYAQARLDLAADATDLGVDITTLRARQPIRDFAYESVSGVCDAEKGMSARRIGHFAWSVPTSAAISPGSTSQTALFEIEPPAQAAVEEGATSESLTVLVYAKVTGGTGSVQVAPVQATGTATVSVTSTSFAWAADNVTIETEDLTAANGQRTGLERFTITAADPAGQTLSIAAICVVRGGSGKL